VIGLGVGSVGVGEGGGKGDEEGEVGRGHPGAQVPTSFVTQPWMPSSQQHLPPEATRHKLQSVTLEQSTGSQKGHNGDASHFRNTSSQQHPDVQQSSEINAESQFYKKRGD